MPRRRRRRRRMRRSGGPTRPDVTWWRPGPAGPQTLREYLAGQNLPEGVVLPPADTGAEHWMMAWVRAWALGLRGQQDPATRRPYTPSGVATLSGLLASQSTVRRWWQEAAAQAPPPPEDGT